MHTSPDHIQKRNHAMSPVRTLALSVALALPALAFTSSAMADSANVVVSQGSMFTEESGADLYHNICQACHMDEGQGAEAAGSYPALAGNEALASQLYPAMVVVNGLNNMPPLGAMLSDEQVAEVVNYIRTSFGNDYDDPISAEDVVEIRE